MPEITDDRDRQLRRQMLVIAKARDDQFGGQWVGALLLATARDQDGHAVDDDQHAARLLDDLVGAGLLEEARKRYPDAPYRFADRRFRMTHAGWALLRQIDDPHPLVWDSRTWEAE